MKNRVSYEKQMRDRAASTRRGLYTIEIINASKTAGKLGSRMTMQGPASKLEENMVSKFMLKLIRARNKVGALNTGDATESI